MLLPVVYQYAEGGVSLEFVRALDRGYEFQLKNGTPSDKVVTLFRVLAPPTQHVIFHTTQDLRAIRSQDGSVTLPGGNVSYIPATEYKELDGQTISANSDRKFRVPPLSDRPWMEPDAATFSIKYEIVSSNPVLSLLEHVFSAIGLRTAEQTVRYLVVNNYWIPTNSNSPAEAIQIFCRDNDDVANANTCRDIN